jgi:hypothetical protein
MWVLLNIFGSQVVEKYFLRLVKNIQMQGTRNPEE